VVRREERVRFPEKPGVENVPYYFESLDYRATERKLSAFLADFQETAGWKGQGRISMLELEFLYVLKGSLAAKIGGEEFTGGRRRDLLRRWGAA